MRAKVVAWFWALGSAVIGGGAGAVTSSGVAALISPDFRTLGNFFKLAAISFAVNGFFAGMLYLKQSPLPPPPTDTDVLTKQTTETKS